jgi:hypothetical protein
VEEPGLWLSVLSEADEAGLETAWSWLAGAVGRLPASYPVLVADEPRALVVAAASLAGEVSRAVALLEPIVEGETTEIELELELELELGEPLASSGAGLWAVRTELRTANSLPTGEYRLTVLLEIDSDEPATKLRSASLPAVVIAAPRVSPADENARGAGGSGGVLWPSVDPSRLRDHSLPVPLEEPVGAPETMPDRDIVAAYLEVLRQLAADRTSQALRALYLLEIGTAGGVKTSGLQGLERAQASALAGLGQPSRSALLPVILLHAETPSRCGPDCGRSRRRDAGSGGHKARRTAPSPRPGNRAA